MPEQTGPALGDDTVTWTPPAFTITRLIVSPLHANCYLLACRATGAVLVVDAGDEAARILIAIARLTDGATGRVAAIVNTHGHVDHTAAVGALRAALGAVPVLMHSLDVELVLGNGPDAARLLGREYQAILPDRTVDDGDEIRWGACAFRVLARAGPPPGGGVLFVRAWCTIERRYVVSAWRRLLAGLQGGSRRPAREYPRTAAAPPAGDGGLSRTRRADDARRRSDRESFSASCR